MDVEHGDYIITVEGTIITVTMSGAFNEYGIKECIRKIRLVIEELGDNTFLLLNDMLKLNGATPEAFHEINKFNLWLNNKPLHAFALVIKSSVILDILRARITLAKQQKVKVFDNNFDAINWLQIQPINN